MLSNLAETKSKNKQVAKIWGLKKQRFGDSMYFPEGLENTPFNHITIKYLINFVNAPKNFVKCADSIRRKPGKYKNSIFSIFGFVLQ